MEESIYKSLIIGFGCFVFLMAVLLLFYYYSTLNSKFDETVIRRKHDAIIEKSDGLIRNEL